jgi:hypothetical protein
MEKSFIDSGKPFVGSIGSIDREGFGNFVSDKICISGLIVSESVVIAMAGHLTKIFLAGV